METSGRSGWLRILRVSAGQRGLVCCIGPNSALTGFGPFRLNRAFATGLLEAGAPLAARTSSIRFALTGRSLVPTKQVLSCVDKSAPCVRNGYTGQNIPIVWEEQKMKHKVAIAVTWAALTCVTNSAAKAPPGLPNGGRITIVDIGKIEWAPLQLQGLPPGIEIAVLRGDLAKGGGEILLRTPPKYVVPNHSHTSDEVYVWLKGAFTYVAADGTRQRMNAPAYISLPGQSPRA